jgi:hypothetical protein
MLLWPRLDRARLRRIADDPTRIAELVERRTAQPYDVILAMLTRQSDRMMPSEAPSGFESGRTEIRRVGLRIVRSEESSEIEIADRLPA